MTNINLRDVEKIIAKKEKEGITFKEAAESYADAHGCGYMDIPIREIPGGGMISKRVYVPVRPLPCVRDEHGEITNQTVKDLVAKIDSELTELKWELASYPSNYVAFYFAESVRPVEGFRISEEAADTITAITTMLEALGINAEMRDEAQRRVNDKNRKRNRL